MMCGKSIRSAMITMRKWATSNDPPNDLLCPEGAPVARVDEVRVYCLELRPMRGKTAKRYVKIGHDADLAAHIFSLTCSMVGYFSAMTGTFL